MKYAIVHVGRLRSAVAGWLRSNAWTRAARRTGSARQPARLRYWDGTCVS
jgi:hypothetical protein